ncbi:MAG TPA: sulfurtransferase [Nitrososphaeraceae archaeon]|jgi:thiosulfate/3-mercaptopyruvate sulfurtransferase|nr:sulfurtransferase [Nitrososphaeraceae archaeon]
MEYAHPNVIVDTKWIYDHLNDPQVRIAEVDYNPDSSYRLGHIPGAALFDWKQDLNDPNKKDIISKEGCEDLLQRTGVNNDTILILYGDYKNWFAAFAFWVFKYYGFNDVRLINGARKKWFEEDRPVSLDVPSSYPRGNFKASEPDNSIRVFIPYVRGLLYSKDKILVDVRGPEEYSGKILAPPEYASEQPQRGGHIPGAINIPWDWAVNEDGTFKSADELEKIYASMDVAHNKEVITYCRIGERSAYTWFVLKYLLGYPNVKNYEGSWAEWGSTVGNPIEK